MYGFAASSVRFLTVFGFCDLAVPNTICKSIENRANRSKKVYQEKKREKNCS